MNNKRTTFGLAVLGGLLTSGTLIVFLLGAPKLAPVKNADARDRAVASLIKPTSKPPDTPATNHSIQASATPGHTGDIFNDLSTWAMNSDDASRDAILAEMRNPDKEVREAALQAAIQFGSRSVVPTLRDVADETEDAAEKAAILEAIEYINLPSLTEFLAQKRQRHSDTSLNITPLGKTRPFQTGGSGP